MNFDLENVRPFLERIRPHTESDFADAQIDELVAFIEATPVEQEREMRLTRAKRDHINRRGRKTSWVRTWPLAAWAIRPPQDGGTNPGRTANKARENLRAIMLWAWEHDYLAKLPGFPKPKPQRDVAGRHYFGGKRFPKQLTKLKLLFHGDPIPQPLLEAWPEVPPSNCAVAKFDYEYDGAMSDFEIDGFSFHFLGAYPYS